MPKAICTQIRQILTLKYSQGCRPQDEFTFQLLFYTNSPCLINDNDALGSSHLTY